ncbi:MAG TPA: SAM-dependent methyltransferase [Streptosporangiaceae bacterium]|nr:SAM-dependent methyltransferase [Streptosporangiaceae bacterium]
MTADRHDLGIDTTVPHIARVYDYWLGGKDNFAVDRETAEKVIAAFPDVLISVRAQREFLGRAVRYLVTEAGIRQFLDIGTGLPAADNTHEVAQRIAPQTRVVYVDNDPIVLSHARALLASRPEGQTAYINADFREPGKIVQEAGRTLDFSQPVGVMMLGLLHCVPDTDEPAALVRRVLDQVVPGSYLVISHPAQDISSGEMGSSMRAYNESSPIQRTPRTSAEVARFFDGLDLIDPGLVQRHRWRAPAPEIGAGRELANYGGVARKP